MLHPLYIILACTTGVAAGAVYYSIGLRFLARRQRLAAMKEELARPARKASSAEQDLIVKRLIEGLQQSE